MAKHYPDDLRYTKDHEWARIDAQRKRATIGVTHFAVSSLGDVTQLELPREGETFKREDVLGQIESVKAVSDIFAPLSGKIVKTNDPLRDSPEMLNGDECYDEGWIAEIELTNPAEFDQLMTANEYEQYVKENA